MTRDQKRICYMGLYYACYKLCELGYNPIITKNKVKDSNIVVCQSMDKSREITIRTRSFSKKMDVALGRNPEKMCGETDFWIIVTHLNSEESQTSYILHAAEVKEKRNAKPNSDGRYWLSKKNYDIEAFKEKWDRIGIGF